MSNKEKDRRIIVKKAIRKIIKDKGLRIKPETFEELLKILEERIEYSIDLLAKYMPKKVRGKNKGTYKRKTIDNIILKELIKNPFFN
ncbi:MAG: hypothetical protein ACTSRP_07465 [Candidatus Helarchaeota archaeon]